MHISYQLYCKYRLTSPMLNSHLIYLCIFKAQSCPPNSHNHFEATFKNLRGVKFNGLNPLKWVIGGHSDSGQAASPDILTVRVAIQNSSLFLPPTRTESTFVPSADTPLLPPHSHWIFQHGLLIWWSQCNWTSSIVTRVSLKCPKRNVSFLPLGTTVGFKHLWNSESSTRRGSKPEFCKG